MSFFKKFSFAVKEEDSIVCTTEELDRIKQDRKKREDEHSTEPPTGGQHNGDSSL